MFKKYKSFKMNDKPRISVNPLCEYVAEASAARRTSIIKQCKKPVAFVTKWYNQAEDILSFYLSKVKDDPIVLRVEANRLTNQLSGKEMERKFNEASADSLLSFVKHHDKVQATLDNYSLEMAVHDSKHKFILNGVQISLRPELILRDADGKQQLGFVKFYFSKNEPLSAERGKLMATLTRHYFEQEFGFKFKGQHCLVLDVFSGEIFEASKTYKRDLSNIMAACLEIADRWDNV